MGDWDKTKVGMAGREEWLDESTQRTGLRKGRTGMRKRVGLAKDGMERRQRVRSSDKE